MEKSVHKNSEFDRYFIKLDPCGLPRFILSQLTYFNALSHFAAIKTSATKNLLLEKTEETRHSFKDNSDLIMTQE